MWLGGVLLMTLLSLETVAVNGEAQQGMPRAAGIYDIETRLDDNRTVRFTLSLPQTIEAALAPPLVMVLHYAGQPTRFYGRPLVEELFEPAWRELNAIYVAPEAVDGQWTSATNEAYVLQLLDLLQETYATDKQRTTVAGYSMGAIGSWHFIGNYPERFSAAVPVAGFPRSEVECSVPVYTLATESDEIFDYARLRGAVEALQSNGCEIEFATVDARGHYDVNGFGTALRLVVPWLEKIWHTAGNEGAP
jgi:poly(3-hydroxybutyrate) depolymerase